MGRYGGRLCKEVALQRIRAQLYDLVFVCAEGRNPESLGATYADVIRIMEEYEAVNACMLRVDSASNMLYRDVFGRYGEAGQTLIFNPLYASSAITLRRMPTFWMVKSAN